MMFSVVIATYNRRDSLRGVLGDLARQTTDGTFAFEVIVADNNSGDGTGDMVGHLRRTFPVPLHYLFEPRQGKSYALNRAIGMARGEIIARTDDDVTLPRDWLQMYARTFRDYHADGVGGPVRPQWTGPRPAWLSDMILRQLGVVDYGPHMFHVTSPTTIFIGPNAAYRRELFLRYGGLSPEDPAEDSDWFLRMFDARHRLIYQPAAGVLHTVDVRRLSIGDIARRLFVHGRGRGIRLQEEVRGRSVCRVPIWVMRLYASLHWRAVARWLRGERDGARWQWLQRYHYHGVMAACFVDWRSGRPRRRPRPPVLGRA